MQGFGKGTEYWKCKWHFSAFLLLLCLLTGVGGFDRMRSLCVFSVLLAVNEIMYPNIFFFNLFKLLRLPKSSFISTNPVFVNLK